VRRVTLDTNVYISALNFGGQPKRLLDMAIGGEVEVAISDAILAELERVLRTKFKWEPKEIQETEALIRSVARHVEPKQTLTVVPDDPDDNRIVECAVESGSEAIITNDGDLLRMKEYQGVRMMRVGQFLRERPERGR
jgi:putative PIN family toxin of toxin-antitoxin system